MAKAKRKGILWPWLDRGTAKLYALLGSSWLGRIMTGYRKADGAFAKSRRYTGRHRCTPMSPARLGLLSSVESSLLFKGVRALSHALFCLPIAVYGLLLLSFGLCGVAFYFILPHLRSVPLPVPDMEHAVLSGLVAVLSLPLLFTKKSLAETLGAGKLSHALFASFLGIPEDRLAPQKQRMPVALPYVTVLLSLPMAVGALYTHPLILPILLLVCGLLGLIFTYPEAGVVLSTVLLPAIWLYRDLLLLLCTVILLTWMSYGVKLLFMHRTIRFGLLDTVLLLFGLLILASGFTGAAVTAESRMTALILFICLSDYFLIVNLMTTRAYIRRCLVGVGISVVVVTALAYLRLIPVEELGWLEGSRAGDALVTGVSRGIEQLSGLWQEHSEFYLVLVFPWLYAFLCHTKRLFRRVLALAFLGLDLCLVLMSDSVSALFCILAVTVLFLLLLDHRGLTLGAVLLPAAACGAWWLTYLYPISEAVQTTLSRSRHFKELLADSLWRMTLDHPGGIGMGEAAFRAVYPAYAAPDLGAVTDSGSLYFEALLSFGWGGTLLLAVLLFLFFQKCLTGLRHATEFKDRALILGGITGMVGALIFGTVRSFLTSPRVFFNLILVIAISGAYVNILFDESDVLAASRVNTPEGVDYQTRSNG
ncbi:MAG: hypothetical protein J6K29_01320 [Clostridia bacterium]|nr:hypothetical protein [Clostridia bacterium]MBP3665668.1 hypothetical protein [Clostridia bacterium]